VSRLRAVVCPAQGRCLLDVVQGEGRSRRLKKAPLPANGREGGRSRYKNRSPILSIHLPPHPPLTFWVPSLGLLHPAAPNLFWSEFLVVKSRVRAAPPSMPSESRS
jgi:hypothetical protein